MRSVGGDDVDAQSADEAEQLRLLRESTDDEAQMRRIRRKLPEGRVDRDPLSQKDFRPGVVVKLSAHICEASRGARRQSYGPCESDVELRVLVTVAGPRAQHLR